jgi:hypothetical protein
LPTITIGFGIVLILLGLAGYFGTGMASMTALIPAVFGVLLSVFGAMARDEKKRKTAMHIAVMLGLVGLIGDVVTLLSRFNVERPPAIASQLLMAALMTVYVALCVKSFIDARRKRAGA